MSDAQALAVLLEDRLTTVTRVLGLLRRRNVPVRTVAVEPSAKGLSRLMVTIAADAATVDRVVLHVQKVIGVHEVIAYPISEEYQESQL